MNRMNRTNKTNRRKCLKEDQMRQKTKKENSLRSKKGMELVQVAILIAIAVGLGLIFKSQITEFVNNTFSSLSKARF